MWYELNEYTFFLFLIHVIPLPTIFDRFHPVTPILGSSYTIAYISNISTCTFFQLKASFHYVFSVKRITLRTLKLNAQHLPLFHFLSYHYISGQILHFYPSFVCMPLVPRVGYNMLEVEGAASINQYLSYSVFDRFYVGSLYLKKMNREMW